MPALTDEVDAYRPTCDFIFCACHSFAEEVSENSPCRDFLIGDSIMPAATAGEEATKERPGVKNKEALSGLEQAT